MTSDAQVIEDLGGATSLAAAIRRVTGRVVERGAIYEWKKNGIPWFWRDAVAAVAADQRAPLPRGFQPVAKPKPKQRAEGAR